MGMTAAVRIALAVVACGLLGGCLSAPEGDCVSHYDVVARAGTWQALQREMLGYDGRGHVASLRTQARGHDVGAGNRDAVRVVDLLDGKGRRLVQVEVWRTRSGAWRAGAWSQCID